MWLLNRIFIISENNNIIAYQFLFTSLAYHLLDIAILREVVKRIMQYAAVEYDGKPLLEKNKTYGKYHFS